MLQSLAIGLLTLGICVISVSAEPIRLQWWHAMSGQSGQALEQVVSAFNASQQTYQIEAVDKGNERAALNAALAAYRAGQPPHLLQNNEASVLPMMLSGAIVPTYALLQFHGIQINTEAYWPAVLETYTDRHGRLVAMPFHSSAPLLYYNMDILQKAGIAAPPQTWQEMETQIRRIKATQAAACGYAFAADLYQELENYSVYHNLPFATRRNGHDGLDAVLVLNKTRVVQHIDRLRRWQKEGLATFGTTTRATWASSARNHFLQGQCAFWIDSTAWHSTVEQEATMRWGGAPLPHEADIAPNRSLLGSAAIYAFQGFSAGEYKGIATFFQFLADTDLQMAYHQATGYVPITKTAYEKAKAEGYYSRHPSREIAVMQISQGQDTAHSPTIRLGNFEHVRRALEDELEKVWTGQASAKDALDAGVRKGNAILRLYEEHNRGRM